MTSLPAARNNTHLSFHACTKETVQDNIFLVAIMYVYLFGKLPENIGRSMGKLQLVDSYF